MTAIATMRMIRCPYRTEGICSSCEMPYPTNVFELEEYCRRSGCRSGLSIRDSRSAPTLVQENMSCVFAGGE
ncbi:MAG TPA: hypothetical protein DCP92_12240 [Nitrospiraceae bacterium]|jgi:hypothetical protein|nr:hypothetical protein [Nitrospiraceae bacterium]